MWQRNVSGRDTTLSGMVISLSSLGSGKHVIEYEARVINAGTFTAPPASVELMYAPEIWGRSNIESITIPEVSAFDPNAPNPQKYQAAPNYSSDQSNEDINLDEMSSFKAMIYRIKNLINPLNRFIARYWVIIGSLLIVILLGLLWYLRKQRLIKTPQNKEANPTKPETNVPQADSISNNLSPDSAKPPTQSPNDEQEISGS